MKYEIVHIWDKIFQRDMRYQVDVELSNTAPNEVLMEYAHEIVRYVHRVKGKPDKVFVFFWRDRNQCGWSAADAAVFYDANNNPPFTVEFNRLI